MDHFKFLLVIIISVLTIDDVHAESRYSINGATNARTTLFAAPDESAEHVAELDEGMSLTIHAETGEYYQVSESWRFPRGVSYMGHSGPCTGFRKSEVHDFLRRSPYTGYIKKEAVTLMEPAFGGVWITPPPVPKLDRTQQLEREVLELRKEISELRRQMEEMNKAGVYE
jgi:hypothetical protein